MREPAGTVKSYAQNGLQAPGSMKSVGNEGIPKGCLQVIHVHVLLAYTNHGWNDNILEESVKENGSGLQ